MATTARTRKSTAAAAKTAPAKTTTAKVAPAKTAPRKAPAKAAPVVLAKGAVTPDGWTVGRERATRGQAFALISRKTEAGTEWAALLADGTRVSAANRAEAKTKGAAAARGTEA
jgi:hypothetical protein